MVPQRLLWMTLKKKEEKKTPIQSKHTSYVPVEVPLFFRLAAAALRSVNHSHIYIPLSPQHSFPPTSTSHKPEYVLVITPLGHSQFATNSQLVAIEVHNSMADW